MTVSSFRSDIPQRLNLFLLRADASCDSAVNTTCDQTNDLHLSVRPCCRLILYQELKRHLMKLKLIPRKERERRLLPRPNTLSCNVNSVIYDERCRSPGFCVATTTHKLYPWLREFHTNSSALLFVWYPTNCEWGQPVLLVLLAQLPLAHLTPPESVCRQTRTKLNVLWRPVI